jgi:UDP-GlcNAc:undecaprenyl-phosphate/decaprenyl-phosphate GlcNAc-1-phosphate transferase
MIEITFLIEAALAFLAVFMLIPGVIALCNRWKIQDTPGPLKIHLRPVPRLGGIAISTGLVIAVAVAGRSTHAPVGIFAICIAVVAAVGVVDDVRGLSPYARLTVQAAIGVFLAVSGFGLALSNSTLLNVLVTAAAVVTFINAFNFLDGSDGIAAITAAIIAAGYVATAGPNFSTFSSAVAWALLGCAAAFLCFNWPPARIFMGDTGSTVIGLSVVFLALEHWRTSPTYTNPAEDLLPLLLAAVPLADAAFAIIRRLQNFSPPTRGDRSHFYDLLLQRGYSARSAAVAAGSLAATSGLVAWISLRCGAAGAVALIAGYGFALLSAGVWLGSIGLHGARSSRAAGATTGE